MIGSNLQTQLEERKAALDAVLQSKEFLRAPALAKLLKYLCEETFKGRENEIKEFSIATDVYGRSETFGERRDSVVRVEASRLRKRLRNYYAEEGSQQKLRIVIPAGTYQPEFELQAVPASPPTVRPADPPIAHLKRPMVAAFAGAALLLAALLVFFEARHWSATGNAKAVAPVNPAASHAGDPRPIGAIRHPVRILAGSATERSVDRFGSEWGGDRYFIGGEQNHWQFGGKEMGIPVRTIRWAPDQLYFRSFRFGNSPTAFLFRKASTTCDSTSPR